MRKEILIAKELLKIAESLTAGWRDQGKGTEGKERRWVDDKTGVERYQVSEPGTPPTPKEIEQHGRKEDSKKTETKAPEIPEKKTVEPRKPLEFGADYNKHESNYKDVIRKKRSEYVKEAVRRDVLNTNAFVNQRVDRDMMSYVRKVKDPTEMLALTNVLYDTGGDLQSAEDAAVKKLRKMGYKLTGEPTVKNPRMTEHEFKQRVMQNVMEMERNKS